MKKTMLIILSLIFQVGNQAHAQKPSAVSASLKSQQPVKSLSSSIIKKEKVIEAESSDRIHSGKLNFALLGRRYDDAIVNSNVAMMFVSLSLQAQYQNWLDGKLAVVQILGSGAQSSLYGVGEGGVPNVLLVSEANLGIKPFQGLQARAGIVEVDMGAVQSQLYPQNNAGYLLFLNYKTENNFELGLNGSQSLANSTKSNRVLDEDTTPMITLGTLYSTLPIETTRTTLKASVSRFYFTDLSSADADAAQKTGSSTIGNGAGGNLFEYEYRGDEYALALSQKLGLKHEITLKGSAIKNELAPEEKNSGWMGKFELKTALNKIEILPSYTRFYLQSDALPSPYANFLFGYSNRQGFVYNVKLNFLKEKFAIFGGYMKSDVISEKVTASQYQADREVYSIGAEAKYDLF